MRHSSINNYLCLLAFSDSTIIATSFFLFFLESMRKRYALIAGYYALLTPVMFPLGSTAQSLSVFLTVSAAIDCFILIICGEKISQKFCNSKLARWVIF